jgi:hypothetical protein
MTPTPAGQEWTPALRFANKVVRLEAEVEGLRTQLAAEDALGAQVAAVKAALDEMERDGGSECGGREWSLENPESRRHYPDEGWSFCDGCSAAQSADNEQRAVISRVRAALESESGLG